jgi:hypothetical protein
MKINKLYTLIFLFCLSLTAATLTSCSKKTGCPANEKVGPKTDKYGNYKVKKSKSGLFPKKG